MAGRVATSALLHPQFLSRWSPRAFKPNTAIDAAALESVLEAARWAPSCYNEQPWLLCVADTARKTPASQRVLAALAPSNAVWAVNTSALVVVCGRKTFSHNGKPNDVAEYDCGQAALSMVLQAQVVGLAAHQMRGFDRDAMLAACGLETPDAYVALTVLALGYAAPAETLSEEVRSREVPSSRKPLAQIIKMLE